MRRLHPNSSMLRRAAQTCFSLFVLASLSFAGSPGTFLGTILKPSDGHWLYVRSKNGMVRHVEISRAKVSYSDAVPGDRRTGTPGNALQPGTEIRVTAEQDSNGEWKASTIEITGSTESSPAGGTTPDDRRDDSPDDDDEQPGLSPAPNSLAV